MLEEFKNCSKKLVPKNVENILSQLKIKNPKNMEPWSTAPN
jgi:hypothetical protein